MPDGPCDRAEVLFYEAADLPPDEQRGLLDAACQGDPRLRAEVEKLLADDARLRTSRDGAAFLISPLIRATAPTAPLDPEALARPPWPRVDRYRLVRVLGEGGMGTVYEAEQDNPRRSVALKVIRPGLVSPAVLKRFAQEAQILGLLHHPGVAQIHEAGVTEDGQPFFAMEFVRGLPLDEYARRHGPDPRPRLELLARVCDAVQHAHDRGIVHRDLKPSNILVDEAGQPKVLDFGVARAADADLLTSAYHTGTGHLIGTLSYMSPEQVAADPAALDGRSDVYTLGVILFELLAGRLPYPLELLPLPEAARVIREQEPARLGAIDRRLRGDVETIVGRALEKDRSRRYPSAAALAGDIRRHLRHEPIKARPPSLPYRLGKFVRRRKALVVATAALLMLLLGGAAVLVARLRDQVVQQAQRTQEVREALTRAAGLREQARSAASDLGQWAEARAEARRAEAAAASGPVDPGLTEQIAVLLRELNEEEADRRLASRLEAARMLPAEANVQKNRFALEMALPELRQAFGEYGLKPDLTGPAEVAALLRGRPAAVHTQAVAALDFWLDLARKEMAPEAGWLEQVLTAADPDDWRQRLRAARHHEELKPLEDLAREVEADVAAQPPQALFVLVEALRARGSSEGALELLRQAQEAYPGDFWINHHLGMALRSGEPPQFDEAIRFLTAAVALRPDSAGAHLNLGIVLEQQGRRVEAIAAYRRAAKLKPDYAQAHHNLGEVLQEEKRLPEAAKHYRRAAELRPGDAATQLNLGVILMDLKDMPGAADCFHRALALDHPDSNFRAGVLRNLGQVLQAQGDLAGAVDYHRRSVELNPEDAMAHFHLGNALAAAGDDPGAIASYRRAVEMAPQHAEAHCNLGDALIRQADFREALKELKTGHELGSRRKDWAHPSALWVKRCESFIKLDDRLPAILKGEVRPGSVGERLGLAELCQYKRLYVSSVRFWTEALAGDARMANDFRTGMRFRAARAAALAGGGQGEEASRLDTEERVRLRRQALEWLRADLAAWDEYLKGQPLQEAGPRVRQAFRSWRTESALAGVRDADPLASLPAEERGEWQQLWADVAATLTKAGP